LRLREPTMDYPLSLEGLLGRSPDTGREEDEVRQLGERRTK
jgi:hypothetical protein